MTPQPQQEYIISEEMVQCIEAWTGRYPTASKDIVETIRSHPHTPNPCEEQGCTDIHDCDEICEHQRMYTPAWVKQHDTAIRNVTLDGIIKAINEDIEYEDYCSKTFDTRINRTQKAILSQVVEKLESMRGES